MEQTTIKQCTRSAIAIWFKIRISKLKLNLKLESHLPKKLFFISFNDSPSSNFRLDFLGM